jgi:small-conductance mechanosensitive channel/CRP-like cAMP-binding protein
MLGRVDWLDWTVAGTGAFGIGLAALLALLALFALPRGERYLARGPLVLLAVHLLVRWPLRYPDPQHPSLDTRLLSFIATFSLLASMARSAFLLGVLSQVARRFTRPWPRILRDVLQAFLYFAVGLFALRAAGVEPGSLLATSALLTAVIGLSLQETLGNLFAGLSLQAQPPFSVGDWLQYADTPDGIGRVLEINWRATHLVTIAEVEVIVPNGVIAKAPLKNFSRPSALMRHTSNIILPDAVPPHLIQSMVLRTLADLPGVLSTPPPSVLVGPFVERGATYSIRYFVDDFARLEPIEGELRKRLWYLLRRENIELPTPRTRVEAVALPFAVTSLRDAPTTDAQPELGARLTRIDFLAGVNPDVLEQLAWGTVSALYGAGEVIIHEGESGNELFVIERGSVDVWVTREGGLRAQVATLSAGQFFGEAALLRDEQRSATVVASTECQLLVISATAFGAAAELDPGIADRLTSKLASRLSELNKAVADSGLHADDEERRSLLLIERVKRFFHA